MKRALAKIPFSPYAIAVYLLLLSIILALCSYQGDENILTEIPKWLYNGLWGKGGMVFLLQMSFILLLGLCLAKSEVVDKFISKITSKSKNSRQAYLITALFSLIGCWFNWGLGLILGALSARKTGEALSKKGIPFNLGLLAALGYSGMMIFHNGLSASAPLKAEESNAISNINRLNLANIPSEISSSETIFSPQNLFISLLIIVAIIAMVFGSKPVEKDSYKIIENTDESIIKEKASDKLGLILGLIILVCLVFANTFSYELKFLNPNFINSSLLALNLIIYKSLDAFNDRVSSEIPSISDIVLQFPIYFAIMALLSNSGFISNLSESMVASVPSEMIGFVSFLSAGLVNFFVPSGGGQWLIQGPIIVESFGNSGLNIADGIMALAYGDELTNMLQPFWALPVLAITGVKVKQLLPFTFRLFLIGLVIYGIAVLV